MRKKFKSFMLCLLAVSLMSASGAAYAGDEEAPEPVSETPAEEDEVSSKLKESEEFVKADFSEITGYLEKLGSADGVDIYRRDKDIDDRLWEEAGGKPASKNDYTDEQKELADRISDLKQLGDFVAVDPDKREVLAQFKTANNSGGEKIFISDGKRFLLYTDSEASRVVKIRRVVSTIDNPLLFSTLDGKTLERMDSGYKKVLATLSESAPENGRNVYYTADKSEFAWLSSDGKRVIANYRECAENDGFVLLVDDRLGNFGLKNKKTGYIWWSAPLGAAQDSIATPLIANELRSSNVLRYGVPSRRTSNNLLRSGTDDCEISVSDVKDGVRVTYDYKKSGFKLPVEYTLDGDCLRASLKVSEITEPKDEKIATEVTIMGSFGAGSGTEDGFFVIPDGSGALVRFNNGRTMDMNAYQQRIYGQDVTAVPTSRGAVTEQIYLPVYGIVKGDNALLAVAAKGDSNAYLSAQVSKQSNSSFNLCNFTFILRGTDIFYMSGNNSDKLTVFERGKIKSDDIEVRYYPLSGKDMDFTDVAARYRQYLIDEAGVAPKAKAGEAPLCVDLYGGTQKKKPAAGIPVTMKQTATSYSEAERILSQLRDNGADDVAVTYNNWTTAGMKREIDDEAAPAGSLGGKKDFKKLTDTVEKNGYRLYPAADNNCFYSGGGYSSINATCVRISGSYSRIVSYDRAYGIPNGFKDNMSLLSPDYFSEVCGSIADSYSSAGLSGASVSGMASALYGDYGKKNISRFKAMELAQEGFGRLSSALGNGIAADGANAYALPYLSRIDGVPLNSSRFDIFNEDVPFYQAVMHGLIPYSGTAVNGSPDPDALLLMSAATGSLLSYDMLWGETSELKDTDLDVYFYANHENWVSAAAEDYKLLKPVLSKVSGSFITDYKTSDDGSRITSRFSDGTVVEVDLAAKTVSCGGNVITIGKKEAAQNG